MKPFALTTQDLAECWDALEVQADAAHDEWREAKPGKDRAAAKRYKQRIARLMEKIDREIGRRQR